MSLEMTVQARSTLADFTGPSLIVTDMVERDAAGIISQLSRVLHLDGSVPDVLPFYHAALNQEMMFNSGQDCGVAFPHARLGGIRQLKFAMGRLQEPVVWGPKGSWPVGLVFLMAVPATDGARYLNLLASLARLAQQPERLTEIRSAPDATAILSILERTEVRQTWDCRAA